jgi:hypothetical protein
MEEFLDSLTGGAVWGVGFGLALGLVRSSGAGLRAVTKGAIRTGIAATDWVRDTTAESRETLQDLYHEAQAERRARA